ncbi:trans-aconitate 2-methyltransferase [Rhizobium lentis]|uniref:Trans-aconitate 2-methyltransferase n=1 Tax=Rhizobium lentis TaxID=1138194 RepID=A0A7W9CY76_9HYPH|nr:trans-aconitate 2-methyltransferase [Rhizobium lentis]MBB4577154.1 trans-aconitate 2-methyltransferase [Rhizobium lentis]MBB5553717.1 trans-aconitate 2-methyltransferase [Rhizobium lentis]MBB5564312.1 trans-aconitate 2-methyltransferase [Rhizobium lentis]MBB5570763.1 trans-aconitate 2-methyltransferase [Rhizobium lentis]
MAWSASQYVKFEDERTRPARDLLAQVPLQSIGRAVDLGCGPGNSTELIIERYGAEGVSGLDSDVNMLEAARKRLPGIAFVEADLGSWQPKEPADLLFANAVFQWLPDHLDIFERLMDGLSKGGVLAVQMPDNLGEPSHLAMEESAHAGPWKAAFEEKGVRRQPLAPPSAYYSRLIAKAARIDIWHTIYNHPMADAAAIVEWVKGTGLMPYLAHAGERHREAFLADYRERVERAYPKLSDGRVLLRFPRIFMVAVKK